MPALPPSSHWHESLPLHLSVTHHALHPLWMYSPANRFSKCRLSHTRYRVAPSAFPPANSGSPLGVPSKPTAVSPPIQPRTSTPAALAPCCLTNQPSKHTSVAGSVPPADLRAFELKITTSTNRLPLISCSHECPALETDLWQKPGFPFASPAAAVVQQNANRSDVRYAAPCDRC